MARQRFSDEDDDSDDRPRRDDDSDDRPRRRDRDRDDDYDDRPRSLKKPGLATAAGVLWVIWGALGVIIVLLSVYNLLSSSAHQERILVFGQKNAETMRMISAFTTVLVVGGTVLFLLAGIRTLTGGPSSIGMYGGWTIGFCVVYFISIIASTVYQTSLMEEAIGRMGGPGGRPPVGSLTGLGIVGGICAGLIAITVPVLAGIFSLSCNKRYTLWWRATKGRGSY